MLMNEAKRQMAGNGGEYKGPIVATLKDREKNEKGPDPSNLPYLHKNPAI